MIYCIITILLSVVMISSTVLRERKSNLRKPLALSDAVISVLGVIICFAVPLEARSAIMSAAGDGGTAEWAFGMLTVFYSISYPVICFILAVLILSSLLAMFGNEKKGMKKSGLRAASACAASVVMLIIAPMYGFMTQNDTIPLYEYILMLGIGQALIFRSVTALEYFVYRADSVKKM